MVQRLMVVADVMRRLRFRRRKPAAGLRHDRPDHVGNQLAHQFRAAPGIVEIGIMPVDLLNDRFGERHHLEVIDAKQAGAQAIVDVVGVIGDIVGEGRRLRGEGRVHRLAA